MAIASRECGFDQGSPEGMCRHLGGSAIFQRDKGATRASHYKHHASSDAKAGWTVGGGGEYGFGRSSLNGEYLFYELYEKIGFRD